MSPTAEPSPVGLSWVKPLDEALYAPAEEEKAFMKATTGIEDDDELKRHIIGVQIKAFEVCIHVPSRCHPQIFLGTLPSWF